MNHVNFGGHSHIPITADRLRRCQLSLGHVESRVHFVMKASHLSSYVKSTFRFPNMVVGTLENMWDSYSDNFNVKLQCVNSEVIVHLYKAYFHTELIKNYKQKNNLKCSRYIASYSVGDFFSLFQ